MEEQQLNGICEDEWCGITIERLANIIKQKDIEIAQLKLDRDSWIDARNNLAEQVNKLRVENKRFIIRGDEKQ